MSRSTDDGRGGSRTSRIVAIACVAVLAALPALASRVSLLSTGDPNQAFFTAGGESVLDARFPHLRQVSADGRYIVFTSDAPDLVPGQADTHQAPDVFLRDRVAGTTVLVSHVAGSPVTAGNGESSLPNLSADGRWVVFQSTATNLVTGQTGPAANSAAVFLFDRTTGAVTLVSHMAGSPTSAAGAGGPAVISADGAFIAFTSGAALMAGQSAPGHTQLYVHDRAAGTNTLVSHAATAATASSSDWNGRPAISADGRWIAFQSDADDLVPGESFGLFLHDRTTGANTLIAPARVAYSDLTDGSLLISADGRWIAFDSEAPFLIDGQDDTSVGPDTYLFDRDTGALSLVNRSILLATRTANGPSVLLGMSGDGGWLVFLSEGSNLVAGQSDSSETPDLFLFERATGTVTLVSHTTGSATTAAEHGLDGASVSADGRFIAFTSHHPSLVPGQSDHPSSLDVFLFDRTTGTILLVSHTADSTTTAGQQESLAPRISGDGAVIAFTSQAFDLVSCDDNQVKDVFLYDRATGVNTAASVDTGQPSLAAGGSASSVSPDGRWVLFSSNGRVLPGQVDANHAADLFLLDRATGTTTLVSRAAGATPLTTADRASGPGSVSADGRWVVFTSQATDLVAGQTDVNPLSDVFLFDRETGVTVLVSHASGAAATTANDDSRNPVISPDGAFVAFESRATDLVAGQTDTNLNFNGYDIFLYDVGTGATTLVSHAAGSATTAGDKPSTAPRLSADGGRLAFASRATNLVPGQIDGSDSEDVFLYDHAAGTTTLVSHAPGAPTASATGGSAPDLSADGSWIVFRGSNQIRLFETATGTVSAVTPSSSGTTPRISGDGGWIAFASDSPSLVPGQTEGTSFSSTDVFLHDRAAQTTRLVSHLPGQPTAAAGNSPETFTEVLGLSADGRFVLYSSQGTGIVQGQADVGSTTDLFLYDRDTGESALVSRTFQSPVEAGSSPAHRWVTGALSADGGTVAFTSTGSGLAADDRNCLADAFLYDNGRIGSYFTLPPCRVLDTRQPQNGPPWPLTTNQVTVFHLYNVCGIPETAKAVAVNVTATGATGQGHLTFYRGDALTLPGTSTLGFRPGLTRATFAILPLAANAEGSLKAFPFSAEGGVVHVLIDIAGYFE